ncbi:carbonic anhydrase family protein [Flavitalea flava]
MKSIHFMMGVFLFFAACENKNNKPTDKDVAATGDSVSVRDTVRNVSTIEFQQGITPEAVLEKFKVGNRRFLDNKMLHRDYLSQVDLSAKGQHPYAIIVSCVDSRKPAEIIFDKGIGDMFNARIAGNFVNTDILGSLEFACKVSGAKLILVMGHSDCGAIKSACDHVKLGNITSMLANITPAVNAVKGFDPDRTAANKDFVAAVAKQNVIMAMAKILKESPILKEMVDKKEVIIAGCMYNLKNGTIDFY